MTKPRKGLLNSSTMTIKELAKSYAQFYQEEYRQWCLQNPGSIMHGSSSKAIGAEMAQHCETLQELSALIAITQRRAEAATGPNGHRFVAEGLAAVYSDYLKGHPDEGITLVHPDDFYTHCMKLMEILHPNETLDHDFDGFLIHPGGTEVYAKFSRYCGGETEYWSAELPQWAFEYPLSKVRELHEEEQRVKAEEEANQKRLAEEIEARKKQEIARQQEINERALYETLKLKFEGHGKDQGPVPPGQGGL